LSPHEQELAALRGEVAALRARLAEIEGSRAWRLIAPLRGLAFRYPWLKLAFWLASGRFGQIRTHLAQRRLIRAMLRMGLFDEAFYRGQLAYVAPGADLLRHYATTGRHEGLWPNRLFDPAYVAESAGVPLGDAMPHFIAAKGVQPHRLFDPVHYASQVPEAAGNALGHFLRHGQADPNPAFDSAWYRTRYGIGAANPLLHFIAAGDARETNGRRIEALRARQLEALGTALPPGVRLVVGIVTYNNEAAVLQRAVRSVRVAAMQAGVEAGLVLLDNGGPASEATTDVRILPTAGNVGFGAGHNRLMQAAWDDGATHYLALNPDAALHPDGIGALLRMVHAAKDRALVQAIQFPAEYTVTYDPATFETPWISGACMLIPRAIFDVIGGFDDGFFMYCEDVDLSWRARVAGFRTLTCPAALLFHPNTGRVLERQVQRMFLDSCLRMALKWGDRASIDYVYKSLAHFDFQPPHVSGIERIDAPGIADFDHGFNYGPGRW
jgi:GT2 family glycosyltransferase